ncbi:MAG: hypothetical protein EHM41_11930, partial [Chloroflexi bacterium]
MTDTQWPRFQVFLQEKENDPYQDVGSVHAPDLELALLNARDVFVRRPECHALWVVPARAIYSRTAEELSHHSVEIHEAQDTPEKYYIFCKHMPAGTQTYAGEVNAGSAEEALLQGIQSYTRKRTPFVWWVFRERDVLQSDPADAPSFFDPAYDKKFRLSTDFHTVSAMRQVRGAKKLPETQFSDDACALPE